MNIHIRSDWAMSSVNTSFLPRATRGKMTLKSN